jgi:DNA-binding NarL/FixJ family response regulator
MAKVLMSKLGVTINSKPAAKDADLAGNKTVVFVIGYSSKGLGAAGIDLNAETQRVKKLAQSARSAGIKVVAMHIGGSARRGESSNQLIEAIVHQADAVIVVADGNKDKIFNKYLRDGAEFYSVNKIAEASTPLAELFDK